MREIKFRGKDTKGVWRYGDLTHNQKVTTTGLEPRVMVGGYEVQEKSIGQFTGLYDKDGREIYEGDIVKNQFSKRPFGIVTWHTNGFFFIDDTSFGMRSYCDDEYLCLGEMLQVTINDEKISFEVIGNVLDDKELITK